MNGIQRICKIYGRMRLKDKEGNEVLWLWDYANDKPRKESDMTKEEIRASEKAKGELLKAEFDKLKQLK